MKKTIHACPNCGRSVTKKIRKFEKMTFVKFLGAVMNFDCDHCEEKLLTGHGEGGMIVLTQKQVDKVEARKRMERFDPCI